MIKNTLKELVQVSTMQGALDEKVIQTIAASLNRKELKQYIKALKNWEKEQSIIVRAEKDMSDQDKEMFISLFPNKHIHFQISPSLLLGVKIIDNDTEYELNLKNKLERILSRILRRND